MQHLGVGRKRISNRRKGKKRKEGKRTEGKKVEESKKETEKKRDHRREGVCVERGIENVFTRTRYHKTIQFFPFFI